MWKYRCKLIFLWHLRYISLVVHCHSKLQVEKILTGSDTLGCFISVLTKFWHKDSCIYLCLYNSTIKANIQCNIILHPCDIVLLYPTDGIWHKFNIPYYIGLYTILYTCTIGNNDVYIEFVSSASDPIEFLKWTCWASSICGSVHIICFGDCKMRIWE